MEAPNTKQELIKLKKLIEQSMLFLEKKTKDEKYGEKEENIKIYKLIRVDLKKIIKSLETQIGSSSKRKKITESPNQEIVDLLKEIKKEFS